MLPGWILRFEGRKPERQEGAKGKNSGIMAHLAIIERVNRFLIHFSISCRAFEFHISINGQKRQILSRSPFLPLFPGGTYRRFR